MTHTTYKTTRTVCKNFIRPYLDYGSPVYDKCLYKSFYKKVESVQYNAALGMTDSILGTNTEMLYHKLGSCVSCEGYAYFKKHAKIILHTIF